MVYYADHTTTFAHVYFLFSMQWRPPVRSSVPYRMTNRKCHRTCGALPYVVVSSSVWWITNVISFAGHLGDIGGTHLLTMSSLAFMGFFCLADGKRVMTTRANNTHIWHAHYTSTVQCADSTTLPANIRIYSPINDIPMPTTQLRSSTLAHT